MINQDKNFEEFKARMIAASIIPYDQILIYETMGQWWTAYLRFEWMTSLASRFIVRRVDRKYKSYQKIMTHKLSQ